MTVQSPVTADGGTDGEKLGAVILDATGLSTPGDLASAHDFLAPAIKRLRASGRVLILADPPADADSPAQAAARQALDGLVRSIGKELLNGSTANLVYVARGRRGLDRQPGAVLPLRPVGLRRRPGRDRVRAPTLPDGRGRRAAAGRQGRRRHRGRARHRRRDRPA